MSHSRGKDKENPGKFAYQCYDWNGKLFRAEGNFSTYHEADRSAERAEREMMISMAQDPIDDEVFNLSDDEILNILKPSR